MDLLTDPNAYIPNSHNYPPFKNGMYMEEYFLFYMNRTQRVANSEGRRYLPLFWTNFQTHPSKTPQMLRGIQSALNEYVERNPCDAGYFVVVQHDDGPELALPPNTLVYGACTGSIPLPLIYEDRVFQLRKLRDSGATTTPTMTNRKDRYRSSDSNGKYYLCSFIGSATVKLRHDMMDFFARTKFTDPSSFYLRMDPGWSSHVPREKQDTYIDVILQSKFVLAPRGYGRSSFRFFEILELGAVPVYIWDDVEWLPYLGIVDYSKFSISIHISQLPFLETRLLLIDDAKYAAMLMAYQQIKHVFQLESMSRFIVTGNPYSSLSTAKEQLRGQGQGQGGGGGGEGGTSQQQQQLEMYIEQRCSSAGGGDDDDDESSSTKGAGAGAGAGAGGGGAIVWITLINAGYLEYTRNFLYSVEFQRVLDFQLVVFCLDDECIAQLQHHPHCLCIDARPILAAAAGGAQFESSLQQWSTSGYKKIVFAKLDVISFALDCLWRRLQRRRQTTCTTSSGPACSIGYIDTDIVLFQDPSPHLLAQMELYPQVDIFSQCDESYNGRNGNLCSDVNSCPNLCSGVIVFRGGRRGEGEGGGEGVDEERAARIRELLDYRDNARVGDEDGDGDRVFRAYSGDQEYLREKLGRQCAISNRTVDKNLFVNGSCFLHPSVHFHKNMVLLHFNYLIGDAKRQKMQEYQLWWV